jgi:2-phosphoglycerate kinase
MEEIRQIHDYIQRSARRRGIYAVENLSIDSTSDAAVAFVANRVYGIAEKAGGRRSSSLLLDASHG